MTSSPTEQNTRRLWPKLLLSLLIGGLFAWMVVRGGVPIVPSAESFENVRWWTIPAYLLTLLVTHFFRASRWRFLIRPVKRIRFKEVIALNWIGFFAIFALPLRLGELARPALTKIREDVPVSVGIGTIAVERVLDGLIMSLCVAWALFALPMLPTDDPVARALPFYGYTALTVFSGALVALAAFLWQRELATALTGKLLGIVSPKLGHMIASKVDSVAEGIRSMGSARLSALFLVETILYWGSNAAGMWLLAWGCGIPMDFGHAVAIMGVLAIGILLPTGPGLFGNFQLAIVVGLRLYFPEAVVESAGAVYIFWLYVTQSLFIIAVGMVPLYMMKIRFSDLLRVEPSPVEGGPEA